MSSEGIDVDVEDILLRNEETAHGSKTSSDIDSTLDVDLDSILDEASGLITSDDIPVDGTMHITVSDPMKQGEGMSSYVSYKVSTKTTLTGYNYQSMSTVRRYSDFLWLHQQLALEYPGIFIPPVPEKVMMGRFSPEFVDSRRRSLEKFVQRVAKHPILQASSKLQAFLEANDDGLMVIKEETRVLASSGSSSNISTSTATTATGFMKWISNSVASVASSLTSHEPPKTEEDLAIDDVKRYVSGLSSQMDNVHRHTSVLLQREKELGKGMFEFGLAFALLGKCEEGSLSSALSKLGHTSDRLSQLAAEQSKAESLCFEEPLQDYTWVVASVTDTLSMRDQKLSAYHAACNDLENAKQILSKQQAGDDEFKLRAVSNDVVTKGSLKNKCKHELDVITSRITSEMGRFNTQKEVDFKKLVLEYVILQIEYSKKVGDAWEGALKDLNAREENSKEDNIDTI